MLECSFVCVSCIKLSTFLGLFIWLFLLPIFFHDRSLSVLAMRGGFLSFSSLCYQSSWDIKSQNCIQAAAAQKFPLRLLSVLITWLSLVEYLKISRFWQKIEGFSAEDSCAFCTTHENYRRGNAVLLLLLLQNATQFRCCCCRLGANCGSNAFVLHCWLRQLWLEFILSKEQTNTLL